MRESFIPKNFLPPKKTVINNYLLVPITTKETEEDWKVITTNADIITKLRGGGSRKEWPYSCTLEENFKDLAWLELCAKYKQLFCYIIRNKTDGSYIGCVYIYPIELFFPDKADKFDVDFSCWIIQSEFDKGNYNKIFKLLLHWLSQTWPFEKKRIYLRNKLIPKNL